MGNGNSKEESDKCILNEGIPVYLKNQSNGKQEYKVVCYKNDGLNGLVSNGNKSLGKLKELDKNKFLLGEELNKCNTNNGVLIPELNTDGKFILQDGKKYNLSCINKVEVQNNMKEGKQLIKCINKEGIMVPKIHKNGKYTDKLGRKMDYVCAEKSKENNFFMYSWEYDQETLGGRTQNVGFIRDTDRNYKNVLNKEWDCIFKDNAGFLRIYGTMNDNNEYVIENKNMCIKKRYK